MAGEEALLAGGGGDAAAANVAGGLVQTGMDLIGNYFLQENAYERNLEQWNRANAYNDPSAVLARMEKAGLNPVMMYSSGQGISLATPSPEFDAPDFKAPDIGAEMLEGVQVRNADATTANLMAQRKLVDQQASAAKIKKDMDEWNLKIAQEVTKKTGIPMTTNDSPINAGFRAVGGLAGMVDQYLRRKNANKPTETVDYETKNPKKGGGVDVYRRRTVTKGR